MESALSANPSEQTNPRVLALRNLWPSECLSVGLFVFLAFLAVLRHNTASHVSILLAIAALLFSSAILEAHYSTPLTRILREWLSLCVILLAYWSIEWFATPTKIESLQNLWLGWDRALLEHYGLRGAIESLGAVIPFTVEIAHLMLYIVPPIALIALQLAGNRSDRRQFLYTLFLGTFSVYALLPLIAVESPRRVFPHQDEPRIVTAPRQINTYLLNHMDISTGVFPSGHVAVAYSTAFGLLGFATRRSRSLGLPIAAFVMGTLVYLATIYGRYHYAVDGLASIAIAAAAWLFTQNRKWSVSDEV